MAVGIFDIMCDVAKVGQLSAEDIWRDFDMAQSTRKTRQNKGLKTGDKA